MSLREDTRAPLPDAVRRRLGGICGPLVAVEPLGGLSGSRVLRVRGARRTVVAKGGAKAAEVEFYRAVAPLLAARGVGMPALHWAGAAAGRRWLILEEVPRPLPRERWDADGEVLAVLARVHGGELLPTLRARDAYRPGWTADVTIAALEALPADEAIGLGPVLDALRVAASPLFAPQCALSGDANPTNWGLRADGTLVLFDWERFCRGTPALDLAPTVPGLGVPEDYARVARRYLEAKGGAEDGPRRAADLARDVGLAKAWTAVELLAGVGCGQVPDGPTAAWLRAELPGWLRGMAAGWVTRGPA